MGRREMLRWVDSGVDADVSTGNQRYRFYVLRALLCGLVCKVTDSLSTVSLLRS